MTLANLSNIPNDLNTLAIWTFSNQDEHLKIAAAIRRIFNVRVQAYILDPMPLHDRGAWLYNHQQAHNQQNAILGIAGNDLTQVDFDDPAQVASWVDQHNTEHILAAQILRLN